MIDGIRINMLWLVDDWWSEVISTTLEEKIKNTMWIVLTWNNMYTVNCAQSYTLK